MMRVAIAWFVLAVAASAAEPDALFEEAETLARIHRNDEAMVKVREAVAEIDRRHASGGELSWAARNGLRFAAKLAREDLLDYDLALAFSNKLFDLSNTPYWRTPARLDRAMTYRAMGRFADAAKQYDAIIEGDERERSRATLPRAEMVYFDMGESHRGRELIVTGLNDEAINARERFNTLWRCAQDAMERGRRAEALQWLAMLETMPYERADEKARHLSRVWLEMGRIEASRGRTAEAKQLYRKAMELEEGEMRFRTQARDAIERIEYFE